MAAPRLFLFGPRPCPPHAEVRPVPGDRRIAGCARTAAGRCREDLVFTARRGGPPRESKFVPDRFKPAIGAANDAIAQLGHATASITLGTTGTCSLTSWTPSPAAWRTPAPRPWRTSHGPSADQRSCPSAKVQVSDLGSGCRIRGSNPHATLLRWRNPSLDQRKQPSREGLSWLSISQCSAA